MIEDPVDILLSTYNGQLYLSDLLCSIERQSYKNWRLFIRDDQSSDKTVRIIKEFKSKHNKKVIIIPTNNQRLGVISSFSRLLENSTSDLIMLCDQDDIWNENKILSMVESLHFHIRAHNLKRTTPILLFSDLQIIDSNEKVIYNSFWEKENIKITCISDLYINFFRNFSPGCNMLFNRALLTKTLPFPPEAVVHDWWISLNAAYSGKIFGINKKLMKYRVHSHNVIGISTESESPSWFLFRVRNIPRFLSTHQKLIKQAKRFCSLNNLRFSYFFYFFKLLLWFKFHRNK
ncbi:glycosyltransferase family 2 protein [Chitinispirillales bacterium ANBcel5]|uniref:glycosyltransferase family 2 protein n=1 Tax=Cellulosispirillum alkaliphilum TaxID=3039283 RepID=UPI002A564576|nr:glycosyltransferase family 2 protein [Chitinispirillales bacterium ANBcel5]